MSSRGALCIVAAALVAGCGNYSNDDLDFQLALPEQSAIQARMELSIVRLDSAEYYRATRHAVTTFNQMVGTLTALVDLVRGTTPTQRNGNERSWGPWPVDDYPNWQLRLVMQRSSVSGSLLHMDYWLQLRPTGGDDATWVSFLAGSYTSAGSARAGQGAIRLLAADVRAAGYPIDADEGLATLDRLEVAYDTGTFPVSVVMTIVNLPSPETKVGRYDYLQNQDGSGRMSFDWEGTTETGAAIPARLLSQWVGSGAGRADLTAELVANVSTTLGVDCWGGDSVATYSFRLRDRVATGEPATCVF